MELICQHLNENWFARTESEDAADLEKYYSRCEEPLCIGTAIPALVRDLFPKADTPVWFYKKFRTDLIPDPDHRIFLCFDQAICLCEAWVNGKNVGKHVHSEEKFSFDITDALIPGENLLACRVYGPVYGKAGPDGISMHTVPNFAQVYSYYTVIPKTGIYGSVSLRKRPLCRIEDLYVKPDPETRSVTVELTLKNSRGLLERADADFRIFDRGEEICSAHSFVEIGAGESAVCKAQLIPDDVRLWSPDDPFLYDLEVSLSAGGAVERFKKRFGFRSLRVEDGWFVLNGKRIWLSCSHAIVNKEAIVHAKTMGFKALRFLCAMPPEEILDFCDEIGMMVYEECAVSWGMSYYPGMPGHMSAYLDNMLRRDRNHVSVCIWGIFNEQAGPNAKMRSRKLSSTSSVFDFAVSYLPRMRELDDTRLILLSSGRWDARLNVGSFSNPGSDEWEFGWGAESPDGDKETNLIDDPDLNPYIVGLGDVHLYPTVPISNRVRDFVRDLGRGAKPVFISEYGVGSQLDLYGLYSDHLKNSHPDHPLISYYALQIQRLEEWIALYGLENVYPTARDFLTASILAAAGQRRRSIDPVRANPQICGYSLTSFSVGNEGVYFRDGCLIPGIADALRDSFAPLKWSVFTDSGLVYSDTPFEVEIVLCNEDVLPAGEYHAVVSVTGPEGLVFKEERRFAYPQGRPLAASVFRVNIPGLSPGDYTLSVRAVDFEQPTCGNLRFLVRGAEGLPGLSGRLFTVGDTGRAGELLLSRGMTRTLSASDAGVIAVGVIGSDEKLKEEIFSLARSGKRVFILDAGFWEKSNTSEQKFMQSIEYGAQNGASVFGECIYVRNWLYHLDSYAADKRVFAGLSGVGIIDMDLFKNVYPDHYMINTGKPEKTFCASFGSGLFAKDGCIPALTMARFAFGSGSVTVSTFKLLENVGKDPSADIILCNLFAADGR